MCKAYTSRLKKCLNNSGASRLCHIHREWYKNNLWLNNIISHISPNIDFSIIYNIVNDPLCIFNCTTMTLEQYLDNLYVTGSYITSMKIIIFR